MLLASSIVKLVAEIALMALLGRGLVGLLAGARRESNFFYQLLCMLTRPFERLIRRLRHIPLVTFLIMVMIWFAALYMKIATCLTIGLDQCK
jgi:hypothetical protein